MTSSPGGGQGSLLEPEVVAFNWPARPEDRPSARGPVHDCQTPHIEGYRGANKGGPTPQWMVGVYEGGEVVLQIFTLLLFSIWGVPEELHYGKVKMISSSSYRLGQRFTSTMSPRAAGRRASGRARTWRCTATSRSTRRTSRRAARSAPPRRTGPSEASRPPAAWA
jgi:hypothetical protein